MPLAIASLLLWLLSGVGTAFSEQESHVPSHSEAHEEPWWSDMSANIEPLDEYLKSTDAAFTPESQTLALDNARKLDPLNKEILTKIKHAYLSVGKVKESQNVEAILNRITHPKLEETEAIFYYRDGKISPLYFGDITYPSRDDAEAREFVMQHLLTGKVYSLHQAHSGEQRVIVQRAISSNDINWDGCYYPVTASVRTLDNRLPPSGTGMVTNRPIEKAKQERSLSEDENRLLDELAASWFNYEISNGVIVTRESLLVSDLDGNGHDDVIATYRLSEPPSTGMMSATVFFAAEFIDGKLVPQSPGRGVGYLSGGVYEVRSHFDLDNDGQDEIIIYSEIPEAGAGIGLLHKTGETWEYLETETAWGGC